MDATIQLIQSLITLAKNPVVWLIFAALLAYWMFSAAVGAMDMPPPRPATGPDPDRRYRFWFRFLNGLAANLKRAAKAAHIPGAEDGNDNSSETPKAGGAAAGGSTIAAMLVALALSAMLLFAAAAHGQTVIAPGTVKPQNIVFRAGGGEGFDGRLAPYFFIHTGTGVPAAGDCDAAGEVGRLYLRSDPAAANSSLYVCSNTGVATYAWELVQTAGTVTHTAGTLDANQIIIGNGAADVKKLGSLGTTTTVVHGNAAGAPSYGAVVEADQTLADLTTNDVTTGRHGYAPKAPNDTTKFLRGDATWAVYPQTDVQIFTSTNTWTKPANAKVVRVVVVGSGAGGGSGRRGAAGAARGGGGGGGGAAISAMTFSAAVLGATETVTVGVGGAGGTAISADNTNGNNGTAGGPSSFGNWLRATGGSLGAGGTAAGGAGGAAGAIGTMGCGGDGGTGGAAGAAVAGANSGACTLGNPFFNTGTGDATFTFAGLSFGAGGGGGGGGITAANALTSAAAGGQGALPHGSTLTGGTSGGTTVVGGAGTSATANEAVGGAGGGGGSANGAANNTGGAAGIYGAGGGGGGASVNGANSGAGGAGANGIVIVITEF